MLEVGAGHGRQLDLCELRCQAQQWLQLARLFRVAREALCNRCSLEQRIQALTQNSIQ
jgi:hypothetical protein